jgi:hypothetical protein
LTNVVSATDGETTLALVKQIGDDSYEAILPADVYIDTHLIRFSESLDHVPARLMGVSDQGLVDLFNLRLSPKGMLLIAIFHWPLLVGTTNFCNQVYVSKQGQAQERGNQ